MEIDGSLQLLNLSLDLHGLLYVEATSLLCMWKDLLSGSFNYSRLSRRLILLLLPLSLLIGLLLLPLISTVVAVIYLALEAIVEEEGPDDGAATTRASGLFLGSSEDGLVRDSVHKGHLMTARAHHKVFYI